MHDAILCSGAGLPATAVVTQPFRKLATQTAANLGVSGFEVMFIDHPVWTRKDDWIEATAKDVADRLIPVLFKT